MDTSNYISSPDSSAVRTALWRAMHVQVDSKPFILEDVVGLKLVSPEEGWQDRPDMKFTKRIRASIVARARFVEDLIVEQAGNGIDQYVLLGSGLDTFAQRRPDVASRMNVYEIDQPDTQSWKQRRLLETGYGIPEWLHFVPIDFEAASWREELLKSGFDIRRPSVIACTGVSLYLTEEAILSTLNQIAVQAPGSKLAMTFYLPLELLDEEDKPMQAIAEKGAREAGTPMISFFSPDKIMALAYEIGFKDVKTISTKDMINFYFKNRTDLLLPASGEVFLLATT